jgi:hypothetical protein
MTFEKLVSVVEARLFNRSYSPRATARKPQRAFFFARITILLFLFLGQDTFVGAEATGRQIVNIDRDWKFQIGDHPGAEVPDYDDSSWAVVGLPHSFSIPYFGSPKFYVGYGWYRKHLPLPPVPKNRRYSLEFDAAFQDTELYVNGQRVGEHKGGYTGFTFDITDALQPGDNVVAVRLNNLWNPQIAPRAGEHVFSGGIYRDVRLVETDALHVTWYGTFVTTPQVSDESAIVDVKTEVANDGLSPRSATLITRVLDGEGKEAARMESTQTVGLKSTATFDQTSPAVDHPKLWSPNHPYLYSVATTILTGSTPVDTFTSPLGFRWFKFTADQGFYLNGRHDYFVGANVHQDHAGWGDAVTQAGARRDVQMVKDAGFQFIRGSHYPHSPAFVRACDELGILFWSENCFWGTGAESKDGYWTASAYPVNDKDDAGFEESVRRQLTEEIRMYRNDPSVIVWSMSNEPFFSAPDVMPKVRQLLSNLVALSHRLDPTRPAAIGGCQRGDIDKLGDVAGYNGDGATLFLNPGIPSVVTEFESGGGRYGPWGTLAAGKGDDAPPYFWRYPWRSGEALWCAFDHGSIGGRGMGDLGIIDYFRLPKPAYFWWRHELRHLPEPPPPQNGIPAGLQLTADKTHLRADGTDDCQLISTVVDATGKRLSNCQTTTLTIESGPGEFPTGSSIKFDPNTEIGLNQGQGAMEFRSYYSGTTAIRATSDGLKDATITITSTGGPIFDPRQKSAPPQRPALSAPANDLGMATNGSSTWGLNNPTSASGSAPGHGSPLANDGDPATGWQPPAGATDSWWQVDLERHVDLQQISLTFPNDANYRYRIETSLDGVHWTLADDQTQTTETKTSRTSVPAPHTSARYVRIIFPGQPAAIAEFHVTGSLSGN